MKTATLQRWGLMLFGALLLGWLLYGVMSRQEQAVQEPSDEEVYLGLGKEPLALLAVAARELGHYQRLGLNLTMRNYPSGKRALLDGLLTGREHLITVAETPIVFNSFKRDDFVILATIGVAGNEPRVVARRDHGIETPADLRGKRVATQKASAVHFFLHLFLSHHGLSAHDLTPVYLKAEQLAPALAAGEIDAFSMREPFVGESRRQLGDKALIFAEPGLYRKSYHLVTTRDYLQRRPKAVRAVLEALLNTEVQLLNTPALQHRIGAEWLGMTELEVQEALSDVTLRVSLAHEMVLAMRDEARWALQSGHVQAEAIPRFMTRIASQPLRALAPHAVTLIE